MLVPDPETQIGERVKILDFGIAKFLDTAGPEQQFLTNTSSLLGTPMYMSPEQCRNAREVTDRSDIFSLGIIAYQLFSGAQPFRGGTDMEIILEHATVTPMAMREFEPSLPPEIDKMVLAMLSRQPIERPSARDVVQVLAGLLKSVSMSSGMVPALHSGMLPAVHAGSSHDALAALPRVHRPSIDDDDDDGTAPTRDAPNSALPAAALEQLGASSADLEKTALSDQELEKTAIADPNLERTAIAPPGLSATPEIKPPPGFDMASTMPLAPVPVPKMPQMMPHAQQMSPTPVHTLRNVLLLIAMVIVSAAVTLLILFR